MLPWAPPRLLDRLRPAVRGAGRGDPSRSWAARWKRRVLKEQGGWALTVQTRRVGSEVIEDETLVRPGGGPWHGRSYEDLLEVADGEWRKL